MSSCKQASLREFGGLASADHEVQKRYFEEHRLYALQIESTDACPQDCIFCYAGSSTVQTHGLTDQEIQRILEDASSAGIRAIDWLGGDPLVRPGWYELMCRADELGLVNNVWTSGLPLGDPEVATRVHEVTARGFVSVHLDSIFPSTLARLRRGGDSGQMETIVSGVDHLLGLGKSPDRIINCITFTSVQEPGDTIETMRWWMHEKGVRTCLTLFNPAGQGAHLASLEPDPQSVKQVFRERDRINYGQEDVSIGSMDTDRYYCGTMATVTFTGDVTPCSVIRQGVDSIRSRPLSQILEEHMPRLVHSALHDPDALPSPCNRCRHNSHCWGCRASAHHYTGDADGVDPQCWLVRAAKHPDEEKP